jgi:hypothetical protein
MRRIASLLCALLVITLSGCARPGDPHARSANPPAIGDNNNNMSDGGDGGGGY